MAIKKKLIHFKTFENFNSQKLSANEENTKYTLGVDGEVLNGTPDILYQSVVWIKDTQQQWTHGQLYDGKNFSVLVEITYEELKALRDNSQLIPGQQYRITDYVTTTIQENTQSAGHQFDVIVTADDESTLNEVARACHHAFDLEKYKDAYSDSWSETMSYVGIYEFRGKEYHLYESDEQDLQMLLDFNNPNILINEYVESDYPYLFRPTYGRIKRETWGEWLIGEELGEVIAFKYNLAEDTYFSGANLAAWQIWYSLDNDAERFAWADVNIGKGIIYRMIDEWNNDCPYDFKNIQFKHPNDTTTYPDYYYTFSTVIDSVITDHSMLEDYCYGNTMKEYINSIKQTLNNNVFLNTSKTSRCYSNSFGYECKSNSFRDYCRCNSFGDNCDKNSFGSNCYYNSFGNDCYRNSFLNGCDNNSFGYNCHDNSFGYDCSGNYFGYRCNNNSFGNDCSGNYFGNTCSVNSFRVSADLSSSLKSYVSYNHFDDGCSYNVIWNSGTTSSSMSLKNINVNRGVCGRSGSFNHININTLNSEQEINVNQVDGIVSIGNILSITYESLEILRDSSKLIPGRQYRIIDYVTTTSQENTQSAGHPFDIIVTALNEYTLSEEAQAAQNSIDGYFDESNLSAWKLWYCLDNNTDRFAWAGDEKVSEIEHKVYDSSECTINSELIDGNEFITPFNFESCVWADGNGDGDITYEGGSNHDEAELVYEWGYFTDDNDNTHLCLYKSDAGLYEEEGQPDYGDKYLYRGVVNVDGTDYDYWQKWDASGKAGINVNDTGDYVYATTPRIVSNPEAYSVIIETEDIYAYGKGVIYRMIDEWNNDCPYDFKNIQFKRKLINGVLDTENGVDTWCYTFNAYCGEDGNIYDASVIAQKELIEDDANRCYGNIIKEFYGDVSNVGLILNDIVFLNIYSIEGATYFGCYSNSFGNECYNNSFGNNCNSNSFGDYCNSNSFGDYCNSNSFGLGCYNNSFGNECYNNSFGNNCNSNSFGYSCSSNFFGSSCISNSFGNECYNNSFGNSCHRNSFRVSASIGSSLKSYVRCNHFDDGCSDNVIWNSDTTSSSVQLRNINVNRGVYSANGSNFININTLDQNYEIQVAKNSNGEIKVYCEADLIA